MNDPQLLSFRATRRAIGLAVFSGLTLECTFVREVSADAAKAVESTRAFVAWALETFPTQKVLVEEPVTKDGTRARELDRAIRAELAAVHQSVQTTAGRELLARMDRPPRVPRQELRHIARQIWPQLLGQPCNPVALDAAVLGLFYQVSALLNR